MSEHYFTDKPQSRFRKESFLIRVAGLEIPVQSGSGIFSLKELDFGTKLLIEHATIPKPLSRATPPVRVLDLGCGYGIVGVAQKLMHPECQVTMIDINERATSLAKENARINKVECAIYTSNLYAHPELKSAMFDVILTNPPFSAGKKVCIEFIRQSYNHLTPGGLFELVAPHNKGGESLKKVMLEVFGNAGELVKKSGFRVYISVKK